LVNTNVDDWVLKKFGFVPTNQMGESHFFTSPREFDSPFMATQYAADILNKYKTNFEYTRGNENLATQMTQEYVDANYGQTEVNGSKQWTLHPIEKTIGFQSNEGIPAIHGDIIRQLSGPIANLKKAYDNNASDEYWEIKAPANKNAPIQMIKHERAGPGTNTKTYNMNMTGSNFDQWDVNIQTEYGPRNIFLEDPRLGIITYKPDRKWIKDEYMGKNKKGAV
jgi:hypothetical protein